jgi:hypothetical protein
MRGSPEGSVAAVERRWHSPLAGLLKWTLTTHDDVPRQGAADLLLMK